MNRDELAPLGKVGYPTGLAERVLFLEGGGADMSDVIGVNFACELGEY